ncbi:MAG: nucleoside hydrolase [Pelolinea sp.]|nr:nucleoside hydrolase [Pelolinea sp.]
MKDKQIVYIDTDIGLGTLGAEIDDATALMMLLHNAAIQVVGIGSVFGNVPVKDSAANLARFVKFFKRDDIPLGFGADHPLEGDLAWFDGWKQGYEKTLSYEGELPRTNSCDLLIDCVRKYPDQVSVLTLGPMTNIALAIQKSPEIISKVKEVIAMGGSFDECPSSPEFNIHCDPVAADKVIHTGWPVTLLGLEVTRKASFTKAEFLALKDADPATALLKSQAAGWIDRVASKGWEKDGCALHDAVAAVYFLDKGLFKTVQVEVHVSMEKGASWGMTYIKEASSISGKIRVVKEMDVKRCRKMIWASINR